MYVCGCTTGGANTQQRIRPTRAVVWDGELDGEDGAHQREVVGLPAVSCAPPCYV